ncbi:MAG TPA: aldolase/citrate lyase family protein [Usitatibacter sp.]|nr:aldolase/citrate lyase family protein [Usitatibacter sp.]
MSRLLDRLAEGAPAQGAFLFTASADNAEILAGAGFDAIVIDHEHSPGGLEAAVHQMRAIRAASDATILVRLPGLDADRVKRTLDLGAEGLLLPNAESAEDVAAFVAAARYPPHGRRGAHFTVSRAASWGAAGERYYRENESRLLLLAMIESAKGVSAIPAMAGVAGLAMFFLGPLDLTGSIGRMGEWQHAEVKALMQEAERAVLASGMALGGALVPGDTASAAFARGYRFATVGSDVGMLRQAAAAALAGS